MAPTHQASQFTQASQKSRNAGQCFSPINTCGSFFQSGLGGSERMSQLDQRDACHTWRRKEKVDLSRSAVTSSLGIAGQSKEARYCVVVSFLVVSSVLF